METRFADVAEGIRRTLASYAQALDDGRTDEVAGSFCADGWCDMPGLGRVEGRAALKEVFEGLDRRRPQRHLVLNTLLTDWNENEVSATSDVVVLVKGEKGWTPQLVGRYADILHREGDTWRFHSRVLSFGR